MGLQESRSVVVVGERTGVRVAIEQALVAAGFAVVPAGVATQAGQLASLRPLALVLRAASPELRIGPVDLRPTGGGERLELDDIVVDLPRRQVRRGDGEVLLGRREFDTLVVLMRNTPWIVTKRALLDTVWDYDGYSPNVVEVAVSGLRRKLESYGPRVIHTIRGHGYAARLDKAG